MLIAQHWRKVRIGVKRLGLIFVAGLLLVACNRATPTPTPLPPTATIAPTATAQAVSSTPTFEAGALAPESNGSTPGSSLGIASQGAIFTSPRYSYTVVLPCCWLALPTPGTAIEAALAEVEGESDLPVWGDLGERVSERAGGAVLELIALLPDDENGTLPVAQMTVSVLPTNGLTLDSYLEATASELNSIANTEVLTAYIEPALGVGAFPASVIEYTAAPSSATKNDAEQEMAGLQVAFFGHDADTLIVLTFTTTVERFAGLQPEFLHIVRAVTLNDRTV
jgi:hypothetical protein